MAIGARERLGADVSVAVTGVAGPGGGSDEKPVGLTYIAVADEAGVDVQRHQWQGDRQTVKRSSARAALEMLIEHVSRNSRRAAGE
jgi:PncC family amidohydrolase